MNSRIIVATAIALQLAATHDGVAQAAKSPAEIVLAQEHMIFDALAQRDTVAFNKALGSDFVYVDPNGAIRWTLTNTAAMLRECGLGVRWSIDNPETTAVGSDIIVLTYSSSGKGECNGRPSPSPVNSLSVWQKRGDRWVAVAHSETPAAPKQ